MKNKKNILVLSKNFSNYKSGNYHNDIVSSLKNLSNCTIYGPGYDGYSENFTIEDVLSLNQNISFDLIVINTSWDDDSSELNVDPNPNINLKNINIPKVYFLNKEYKKLQQRIDYAKQNKIDLVLSVSPNCKEWDKSLNFMHLNFGICLKRFKPLNLQRKFDFAFTGNLHTAHTDVRFNVKKKIFQGKYITKKSNKGLENFFCSSTLNAQYQNKKIFWAEWGARGYLFNSLLPSGQKYIQFLNQCKTFLNTPSAAGIFGTRFFELMACKTLILCPSDKDYFGILKNEHNCIMFKPDASDFKSKLEFILNNSEVYESIVDQAYEDVKWHSYDHRIDQMLKLFY